jgi:hypothetical protein
MEESGPPTGAKSRPTFNSPPMNTDGCDRESGRSAGIFQKTGQISLNMVSLPSITARRDLVVQRQGSTPIDNIQPAFHISCYPA